MLISIDYQLIDYIYMSYMTKYDNYITLVNIQMNYKYRN